MPNIKKFIIENFKGIEKVEISVNNKQETPIISLLGLNESGKTTILEGLSHFVTGDPIVAKIFENTGASSQALSLIPVDKKANFTGTTKIGAELLLTAEDIEWLLKHALKKYKLEIDKEKLKSPLIVSKNYAFTDGNVDATETGIRWSPNLYTKTKAAKHFKKYSPKEDHDSLQEDYWKYIVKKLPSISYFPTFLVDMPSRIYLSEHDEETPTNRHYRSVLQDVLDSLDDDLDLEVHVAERITDFKSAEANPNWLQKFWGAPGKSQINAVMQKISSAISKEIIGSWNKVFHRPISAKHITIDWNIDTLKNDLPYAEIGISDGSAVYALHERSLGFRWFFSFLLFTRFKQTINNKTIFLFDEPAANLHAGAQTELLKSFEKIIDEGHEVIYSTHSHHMINPHWLSGSYIIENLSIDYDDEDGLANLNAEPTNIKATKYKNFVSQTPTRVSYYQPVIEKLEYVAPLLIPDKPIVVTEGISDFHAFSVIAGDRIKKANFVLVPGVGAGNIGALISLYLGYAKQFIILLDDDAAGRKEKERYQSKWSLDDSNVCTLQDLDENFSGLKLESLLSDDTQRIIAEHFGKSSGKASKKEIGLYFAEKNFKKNDVTTRSTETRRSFTKIIDLLEKKLINQ